jgi:hypothetical protein
VKKTRMNVDDLHVQSFFLTPEDGPRSGTVLGYWDAEVVDGEFEPIGAEPIERTIVRTCRATCCKTCGYTCDGAFTCEVHSLFTNCPNEIPVSSK